MDRKLIKALEKCALGHSVSETVEEYNFENGVETLVKKKTCTKEIAPDLKAVQILLEEKEKEKRPIVDERSMTDAELEARRAELCQMLGRKNGTDGT